MKKREEKTEIKTKKSYKLRSSFSLRNNRQEQKPKNSKPKHCGK